MSYLEGGDRSDAGMSAPALAMVADHFQRFGQVYASSFLNAVPEPSSAALLFAAAALGRRRFVGARQDRQIRRHAFLAR